MNAPDDTDPEHFEPVDLAIRHSDLVRVRHTLPQVSPDQLGKLQRDISFFRWLVDDRTGKITFQVFPKTSPTLGAICMRQRGYIRLASTIGRTGKITVQVFPKTSPTLGAICNGGVV